MSSYQSAQHREAASSLLPLLELASDASERKRLLRSLAESITNIEGEVSSYAKALLMHALADCQTDPSVRKVAFELLIDVLEPPDYVPLLLQRLKGTENASTAALNCLAACCEEIEEEWAHVDAALAEVLASQVSELNTLVAKQASSTGDAGDLTLQIEAKETAVACWKLRIANWKDEKDWADDDEDY